MLNKLAAAALAAAWMVAPAAQAAVFELTQEDVGGPNGGNYCGPQTGNGQFVNGDGDDVCKVDGSPWIVKYELSGNNWVLAEFNSLFGDESDFGGITISNDGGGNFSFLYNADANDPGITAFAAKGGNAHNLYELVGDGAFFGGESISFMFPQGSSNITFFDTAGPDGVIPIPAAGLLLLSALGGLGAARKLRRK